MRVDHDGGDENDAREPPSSSEFDQLIAADLESGALKPMSVDLFDFINDAMSARSCCRACALEANGDDGS